jgi:hypothetical protein
MKEGDVINTPDGLGVIQFFEEYSRLHTRRVCVKLKEDTQITCYWMDELKPKDEKQNSESQLRLEI